MTEHRGEGYFCPECCILLRGITPLHLIDYNGNGNDNVNGNDKGNGNGYINGNDDGP